MNTATIYLSSNPSSTLIFNSDVTLSDATTATFNLSGVSLSKAPVSILFSWGDLSPDTTRTNDYFQTEINVVDEMLYGYAYTLTDDITHQYNPSETSLVKLLSCLTILTFFDNTSCVWVTPIIIYSPSYYTKIGDISLLNTAFIDKDGSILYTFAAGDSQILETAFYHTGI